MRKKEDLENAEMIASFMNIPGNAATLFRGIAISAAITLEAEMNKLITEYFLVNDDLIRKEFKYIVLEKSQVSFSFKQSIVQYIIQQNFVHLINSEPFFNGHKKNSKNKFNSILAEINDYRNECAHRETFFIPNGNLQLINYKTGDGKILPPKFTNISNEDFEEYLLKVNKCLNVIINALIELKKTQKPT